MKLELFIYKLLDCTFSTLKTILLYKNKKLLSAILNSMATFVYLTMMVKLVKDNSLTSVFIITFATFIGTYFPALLLEKLEKDKVWIFNITPDTNERGKLFADIIRENNLPILTYKGFNDKKEPVLCSKVFSETKANSELIKNLIPDGFKYHIIEVKSVKED